MSALLAAALVTACGAGPPGGPSPTCERDEHAVVLCLRAGDAGPSAALLTVRAEQDASPGSSCWTNADVQRCADIVVPQLRSFLAVRPGSTVLVRGDARTVEASIATLVDRHGHRRLREIQRLDLSDGVDTIDVPAGTYVLDAYGDWDQGESTFYFGIRVGA